MTITLYPLNASSQCTSMTAYCSGGAVTADSWTHGDTDQAGPFAVRSLSFQVKKKGTALISITVSDGINKTSWESGTWAFDIWNSVANVNLVLRQISICRINTGCTNQATIATVDPTQGMGSTGALYSFSQSGSAQGSTSNTDRVAILMEVQNLDTKNAQSGTIYISNAITTPLLAAATDELTQLDGKVIIKSTATIQIDGKAVVKDLELTQVDGKAIVQAITAETAQIDGKAVVQDSETAQVDGKAVVQDSETAQVDGKAHIHATEATQIDGKAIVQATETTQIDGKAIVETSAAEATQIDGKAIVKDLELTQIDGKAVVQDSETAQIDGKAIVQDTESAQIDGKAVVKDLELTQIDGKAVVQTIASEIAQIDGKAVVKDTQADQIDGKAIVQVSTAEAAQIDGKAIIKAAEGTQIDGKAIVRALEAAQIDGKAIVKALEGTQIDGKAIVRAAEATQINGKAIIKALEATQLDGKVIIQILGLATAQIDGKAIIETIPSADIFDLFVDIETITKGPGDPEHPIGVYQIDVWIYSLSRRKLVEDLSLFFDEFAEILQVDGNPVECIFDELFLNTAGIEGTAPTATAPTAYFPALSHGLTVVRDLDGKIYTIVGIEPDTTGTVTTLVLEEVD